jgi:hypothetical protein
MMGTRSLSGIPPPAAEKSPTYKVAAHKLLFYGEQSPVPFGAGLKIGEKVTEL